MFTMAFSECGINPIEYNGRTLASANNGVTIFMLLYYPEFVVQSVDWVNHTVTVKGASND